MLQILGYMVAVYAIWKMIDTAAVADGKSTFRTVAAICGILGIVVCVFLVTEQANTVREQTNAVMESMPAVPTLPEL